MTQPFPKWNLEKPDVKNSRKHLIIAFVAGLVLGWFLGAPL